MYYSTSTTVMLYSSNTENQHNKERICSGPQHLTWNLATNATAILPRPKLNTFVRLTFRIGLIDSTNRHSCHNFRMWYDPVECNYPVMCDGTCNKPERSFPMCVCSVHWGDSRLQVNEWVWLGCMRTEGRCVVWNSVRPHGLRLQSQWVVPVYIPEGQGTRFCGGFTQNNPE